MKPPDQLVDKERELFEHRVLKSLIAVRFDHYRTICFPFSNSIQYHRRYYYEGLQKLDRGMNSEFVPKLQKVSGGLSLLNSFLLLAIGAGFLLFPRWLLSRLLDYKEYSVRNSMHRYDFHEVGLQGRQVDHRYIYHENPVDSVSKMIGGVLIAEGLACFVLLYPMMIETFSILRTQTKCSHLAIWNVRASITMQLITGLVWIVIALYDDRGNETLAKGWREEFGMYHEGYDEYALGGTHRRTTYGLLLIGFVLFILGCLSMMISFWPAVKLHSDSLATNTNSRNLDQDSSLENQSLAEPLLNNSQQHDERLSPNGEGEDGEVEACPQSTTTVECDNAVDGSLQDPEIQNNNNLERNDDGSNLNHAENHSDEATSRIRGTKRLLAMAAPQVVYLYIGCITLLIRLPFSLSIPHFVSTTLGALSDGEYGRARREIIWLFILGTIDAVLDFWCIFCKLSTYSDPRINIIFISHPPNTITGDSLSHLISPSENTKGLDMPINES